MATTGRRRTLMWYIVLSLVTCLGTDVALPHLPGAFHLMPGAPSDVIHAPGQAVGMASGSAEMPRSSARTVAVREGVAPSASSSRPRPATVRARFSVSRTLVTESSRSSDTPDDD